VCVLAGTLGPVWGAARFTCRALVAVGALHLLALAASATARADAAASAEWHAISLLLYVAGFALLLPLAAGYPRGPAPRAAVAVAGAVLVLPIAAAFAGPTPAVLTGDRPTSLGPIAHLLPAWVGDAAALVFAVPAAAVVVAVVRVARGDRETRGRLLLPLIALGGFAVLLLVGGALPLPGVTTALFLTAAPLVPAGLILGARPLVTPIDDRPPLPLGAALAALSPREREVLGAMADGETNAGIAARLHISLSAVEKHSTAIFTKLGLPADSSTHRRVAAVVAYLRATR
jgi:DNA-binding CsgD family transcriptional regulator